MVKVYIGSRLSMANKAESLARTLRGAEHDVVSTWHTERGLDRVLSPQERAAVALRDYTELMSADCFVDLVPDDGPQGGQCVEFGMAVAWQKVVVVVGTRNHIFHYLGTVGHVNHADDVPEALEEWFILSPNEFPADEYEQF